jgi:selenocysteine-specific elongation factor
VAQARRVVVGTAGHIDHGKSALVRALTGTDPDRLPEEKARGITIDLGFAHAEWDGITFAFVDVPGHERFVKTMVAGAQGIDVALLVVASDDSVMPQTREHLDILRLLGVSAGVVARTKSDLVDEELGALVDDEVRRLVQGTFLETAPLVPVSAVTGAGLETLKRALAEAARAGPPRRARGIPRLAVDRAFTMKGFGPVVTGTLDGGTVRAGDRLLLFPAAHRRGTVSGGVRQLAGSEVRVRRVEVHGDEREEAHAGERTSLNLAGVSREDLARGQTLFAPNTLEPSALLTAEIELLPSASGPLEDGTRVRLHHGTADLFAKVALLGPSRTLAPGARGFAQLSAERPVAAARGDRFVLRRPSPQETIGGGRLLDTGGGRIRRSAAPLEALALLAAGDDALAAARFLADAGPEGLDAAALARRLGVSAGEAERHLAALRSKGGALQVAAGLFASGSAAEEMARRASALFSERKASGAPSLALGRGEFLEKVGRGLAPAVLEGWLHVLGASRSVTVDGDRVAPPGASGDDLSGPAAGFAARIVDGYRSGGFDPPRSDELARSLGTKPAVVDGLVSHLVKSGLLVRLSPELVVHRDAVEAAVEKLAPMKGRTLAVGGFRDVLGLTRKSLIPLLEYLDTRKKTRRVGDLRVVE